MLNPPSDSISPEFPSLPSRESSAPSEWRLNGRSPIRFDPKVDVELPLIPRSELVVIPAKSSSELSPSIHNHVQMQHRTSLIMPTKSLQGGIASRRFHPYGNAPDHGLATSRSSTSILWSSSHQRGAASLTPRVVGDVNNEGLGHLARLKDNVQRATKAVKESRWARDAGKTA